jgi:hypothetical protein
VRACLSQLRSRTLRVAGGFGSPLSQPEFARATKLFCTCTNTGVSPFLALAAAVQDDERRAGGRAYGGKSVAVVRSASHALVPNLLRAEFGFRDVLLPAVSYRKGESQLSVNSTAGKKQLLARLSEALDGQLTVLRRTTAQGCDFWFIQGYINAATVVRMLATASNRRVKQARDACSPAAVCLLACLPIYDGVSLVLYLYLLCLSRSFAFPPSSASTSSLATKAQALSCDNDSLIPDVRLVFCLCALFFLFTNTTLRFSGFWASPPPLWKSGTRAASAALWRPSYPNCPKCSWNLRRRSSTQSARADTPCLRRPTWQRRAVRTWVRTT